MCFFAALKKGALFALLAMLVGIGQSAEAKTEPFVSGLLMHVTHYDPKWINNKPDEKPFDREGAIEIVRAMHEVGMNTLIVDIEDGVIYDSHPEMTRHYSVPMSDVVAVAQEARRLGIDFIPKLNFSKSGRTRHDHWLIPNIDPFGNFVADRKNYLKVTKEIIDEVLENVGPVKRFHIGMDEDHWRSVPQFVEDIVEYREYLGDKGIETVIWNDGSYLNRRSHAQVFGEKIFAAAPDIPRDVVHMVWDYDVAKKGILEPYLDLGFPVWVAPGTDPDVIKAWKSVMRKEGGNGLILTRWIKCDKERKDEILNLVRELGPMLTSLD